MQLLLLIQEQNMKLLMSTMSVRFSQISIVTIWILPYVVMNSI